MKHRPLSILIVALLLASAPAATIQIPASLSHADAQAAINRAVGGDDVIFTGTRIVPSNAILWLKGGNSTVRYHGSGTLLKDNFANRTANMITIDASQANVVIDGSDGLTLDGAGIDNMSGNGPTRGLIVDGVTFKRIWNSIADCKGRGVRSTVGLADSRIENNLFIDCLGPSLQDPRESYCIDLFGYASSNNVKIRRNKGRNVWQFGHVVWYNQAGPYATGFEWCDNDVSGILRSAIEIQGRWGTINALNVGNVYQNWIRVGGVLGDRLRDDSWGHGFPAEDCLGTQVALNYVSGASTVYSDGKGVRGLFEGGNIYARVTGNALDFGANCIPINAGYGNYLWGNLLSRWSDAAIGQGGSASGYVINGQLNPALVGRSPKADSGVVPAVVDTAAATIRNGSIVALPLRSAGAGYKLSNVSVTHAESRTISGGHTIVSPPVVTISGDGSGARAVAIVDPATFAIRQVSIVCGGSGYTRVTGVSFANDATDPNLLDKSRPIPNDLLRTLRETSSADPSDDVQPDGPATRLTATAAAMPSLGTDGGGVASIAFSGIVGTPTQARVSAVATGNPADPRGVVPERIVPFTNPLLVGGQPPGYVQTVKVTLLDVADAPLGTLSVMTPQMPGSSTSPWPIVTPPTDEVATIKAQLAALQAKYDALVAKAKAMAAGL